MSENILAKNINKNNFDKFSNIIDQNNIPNNLEAEQSLIGSILFDIINILPPPIRMSFFPLYFGLYNSTFLSIFIVKSLKLKEKQK